MAKSQQSEKDSQNQKKSKTVKNIYIKKLNSLMKVNHDEKQTEQRRQKKIRKYHSDSRLPALTTDKYVLKLERNRESAKKARERKKLYVKLLEEEVQMMKEQAQECKRIEQESSDYLKLLNLRRKKLQQSSTTDDINRYLQLEDIYALGEVEEETLFSKMNDYIKQIKSFLFPFSNTILQYPFQQPQLTEVKFQKQVYGEHLKELGGINSELSELIESNLLMKPVKSQIAQKLPFKLSPVEQEQRYLKKKQELFINTQQIENYVLSLQKLVQKTNS